LLTISTCNTNIYYIVESEILKNTQWDIFHIFTSEDIDHVTFSIYAIFCFGLYNKQNITQWLEDMTFIFSSYRRVISFTVYTKFENFARLYFPSLLAARNFVQRQISASHFWVGAAGYIFQALQHFITKFCNFTNFIMFVLAEVFDSLLFTLIKLI
jgi:hypothetical protein